VADDAPAAPAEDDFGDLLADDAPAAPAEDDFGDLLGDDDPAEPAAPAIQLGPVDDPAADNYGDLLDAGTPESADSALPDGDDAFADLLGTPEDSAEAPAIAAEQSDAGFGDAAVGAGPDVSAPLPVGEDFDDLFSAAEAAVEAEEAEADRAGVAEQAGAETPQGTPRGSQPFPEEDFSDLLAGGAPAGAHPDDSGVGLVDDFASDGADAGGFDVGPPGDDTLGGDLATLAPGESDLPDFVEVAEPEAVLPPAGDLIDSALPEVPDASIAEALDDVDPFGADAPLTGNGSFEVADPANSVELEAEVSSLPGVDMGGPSSEGLLGAAPAAAIESGDDDLELLDDDDLELLDDDDLELIEDDEVGEATLAVGDLNAAELVAPSKGVDGLEVVADRDDDWGRTGARPVEAEERPAELPAEEAEPASEAWPDIADELEELDFLLDEKLFSDSHELVNDLKDSYGAHPQLLAAAERIAAAESAAAEDNLAGIAEDGGEPALLEGAHVDDLSDEDGAAFYDLGLAFKEMGQYGKAVEQLEKAARHRERRAEALRLIGLCELEQGHAANAIERFDQALRTPEISRDARVGLYYDLATAFEVQGNAERAQAQLQAIVDEGQPDFLDTQERLQRLSAANG
jgi:tetratricopeptide (TPR) repeat protein